jgi:hypothetical protein
LSQDFAALVVAVGKFAISSTMNATDDRNPLTAAKNVRNSSVDLSPIQTQLAWISEGLCRDKEAADRNRTVASHRRSWGVCHSLAETCGFIIENPLAGQYALIGLVGYR